MEIAALRADTAGALHHANFAEPGFPQNTLEGLFELGDDILGGAIVERDAALSSREP
jgi:hypothetical protein